MSSRKRFDVRTEPLVAEVGEHELRFVPEVEVKDIIGPYRELRETTKGLDVKDVDKLDPEQGQRIVESMRSLLRNLLFDEQARAEFDAARIPDRTVAEIYSWLMEEYGERPTTPSSVS